jgi:LacI family transcriptional regulator
MSLKKIQEMTGFSYSTISRVINGKAKEYRISDGTCRAILKAAERLDYRPNILARSLRLKTTMTIGLIVSDIQNPFFGELASKIERLLRQHGYSAILCNTNEIPENEEFYLQVLVDRKVDGIIIAPIHTEEWDYLENISQETSVVLIDRIFYKTDLPWVTSDNTLAAENTINQLIKLGYKNIAYLGGTPGTYINSVRYQGYQKAFEKNSLEIDKNKVLFKGYSTEAGEEMTARLFEQVPDIDAVFCVNNLVFLGAMKIVQQYERKNHCSIMMAAFDIGRYCNIFKRPLMCANQNLDILAKSAVGLLIDKINDNPRKDHQLISPITVDKHRIN